MNYVYLFNGLPNKYEKYDKGYLNMILKWFKDLPWE